MTFHMLTDCEFTRLECKYKKVGCKAALKRKDMEEHENNDRCHLQLLTGSLTSLQKKYDELASSLDLFQKKLNDFTIFTKFSTTVKIPNFEAYSRKFTRTVHFEASPNTYSIMATLMQSMSSPFSYRPGNYLTIAFSMMEGKNDDTLQWPFSGVVEVQLLNQLEDKDHYSKVIPIHHLDRVKPDKTQSITSTDNYRFISLFHLEFLQKRHWPNRILYFRMTVKSDCCKRWLE